MLKNITQKILLLLLLSVSLGWGADNRHGLQIHYPSLQDAFLDGDVHALKAIHRSVGQDAFMELLQQPTQSGYSVITPIFVKGNVNTLEALYLLVGQDAFMELLQQLSNSGFSLFHFAGFRHQKTIFTWFLDRSQADEKFKKNLQKVLEKSQKHYEFKSCSSLVKNHINKLLEFVNTVSKREQEECPVESKDLEGESNFVD